jgi:chromosome partitioning protein
LVATVSDKPKPASARRKRNPAAGTILLPQEAPPAPLKKILLTASPKGGTGKTTFSKNIAVVAVHMGYRVSVIDFDRQGTLSKWWARRPDHMPHIEHYQAPLEGAAEIGEIDGYDILVVDTPPGIEDHPDAMLALIQAAALVIVPTGPGWDDRESVIPFMRFLRERKIRAAFLLNGVKKGTKLADEARRALLAVGPMCPMEVRDLTDIMGSSPLGLGVVEIRDARGGEDFLSVWHFIRNELALEER